MKRYSIKCLQGTSAYDYTFNEPETEQELRDRFLEQYNNESDKEDQMEYEDFTLEALAELFQVEVIEGII
jgi:hypothetical protein